MYWANFNEYQGMKDKPFQPTETFQQILGKFWMNFIHTAKTFPMALSVISDISQVQ